jgi:hypothetical protein
MNVEIGAEAALFPEKEYINGIFFAVYDTTTFPCPSLKITYVFLHKCTNIGRKTFEKMYIYTTVCSSIYTFSYNFRL